MIAGVGLLGASGGTAWAQPNNQRFTVISRDGSTRAVASGEINAIGTASFQSDVKFPVPGRSFSGTATQSYPAGSVSLAFQGVFNSVSFNAATCVVSDTATGTFRVTGGLGAYQGASGSGTFRETDIVVLQRTPQGCGQPVHFTAIVNDAGHVSLSGA